MPQIKRFAAILIFKDMQKAIAIDPRNEKTVESLNFIHYDEWRMYIKYELEHTINQNNFQL